MTTGHDENYMVLETTMYVGCLALRSLGGLEVVVLGGVCVSLVLCYFPHGGVARPRALPPLKVDTSPLVLFAFGVVFLAFCLKNQ